MQIQHSSQFIITRQPRQVGVVVYLMQHLRLRGRPHHCYGGGATSENRAKINDIAQTRSL